MEEGTPDIWTGRGEGGKEGGREAGGSLGSQTEILALELVFTLMNPSGALTYCKTF